MAKKTKSFSHIETQDALEGIKARVSSGEDIVYELLRIFCGYGDGIIRRIREGIGNKAKDGKTVLIPKLIAYRAKGDLDFFDEIMAMQSDIKITKHSPRLYVVSDGHTIVAADPKEQDIYENEVSLMWKDFDFFCPLAGIEKIHNIEEAEADVKSAELMAKVFDEIRRHNDVRNKEEMHNLNIFMSRLLFCYFAEDTNLFPEEHLFTNSIKQYTSEDGHDLAEFIDRAFLAMSTKDPIVIESLPKQFSIFPYVNGGLFEKRLPIPVLSRRARILMIKCGEFDWAGINPDIFGSMIQAVVTPEMRAGLGMHYTSVSNIMKLIRPLFLDELYEEFNIAKDTKDIKRLRKLLGRLSRIKFFDPACGSGNFLIVSYKCIRELEIQTWQSLRDLGSSELPLSYIRLDQFYGIEIDDFACDTAILSLWLAEHQMNNRFAEELGARTNPLPLHKSGNIVCGNACRLNWDTVCPHTLEEEVYIMGNPPYLGSSMQDHDQKEDLTYVCGHFSNYKNLDYIASWFYSGAQYIANSKSKCAFVSTNSICQGEQVSLLWNPIFDLGIEIGFAYKSFKWSNNAKNNAAVVCVIVGLQKNTDKCKLLYDTQIKKVDYISAYLIANTKSIIGRTTSSISNFPFMIRGSMPSDGGYLIMSQDERDSIINTYPDTAQIIKQYMGADDFLNSIDRYCLWMDEKDFEKFGDLEPIKNRLEKVRQFRLSSDTVTTQEYAQYPYRFRQPQYIESDSIIVPSTSSERREYVPIGFLSKDVVVSNSAYVVYNADIFLFSILTSKMHNLWMKTVCGRMKTDYRYTNTLCYNTFPFPIIPDRQKNELRVLAQSVLDIRDQHFDMTLGEMYNPETMPEDLKTAHHLLDMAVERCYRPEPFASDEERLECLFKLYEKMIKNER